MKRQLSSRMARAPTRVCARGHAKTIEPLERRALLAAMFFDGGGGNNLWNNPDNWSLHRAPTAQDDVTIGDAFNVVLSGESAAAQSLTLEESGVLDVATALTLGMSSYAQPGTALHLQAGGTLAGAGDVNILGMLNWNGGTMEGQGTTLIGVGGRAQVAGGVGLLKRTLRVEGQADLTDGLTFSDGTLEIAPGATLLMSRTFLIPNGGTNRIVNAGHIRVVGPGLCEFLVPLDTSGTVECLGTLSLRGGGVATGTFDMPSVNFMLLLGGEGYTFGAGGKITGEFSRVTFDDGTSTLADPQFMGMIAVNPGAAATFSSDLTASGAVVVQAGLLSLSGAVSRVGVELRQGGRLQLSGTGDSMLWGTVYIDATSRFDIGRGAVIFDYLPSDSPLDIVRGKIATGYDNGTWTGPGICSEAAGATERAIGYAEASALFTTFPATFMGQPVDETSVLVRYTRFGDADLDGTVDIRDFDRLAGSFGAANAYWTQGDFNYSQTVNLSDFNLLAGNFGQSVSPSGGESDQLEALLA